MAHLQELAHTILGHKFFNGLKRKIQVRSRTIPGSHCDFSLSVYRVLKLALLRNHANASLHLHNCGGTLDRSEARDLLAK